MSAQILGFTTPHPPSSSLSSRHRMDHDTMFVNPTDVFSSPADRGYKSPMHTRSNSVVDNDDKFVRYDSSPESLASYNDDLTFSPIDDEGCAIGQNMVEMVRQYLFPYETSLESFTACPIALDRLGENLVSTYLTDYAETVYGFSPYLRPHPMATVLSLSMNDPASLHLTIARSAQFRLSWSRYRSTREIRELEYAMIRHKGEAIQMIRNYSAAAQGKQTANLIAPIISLGMLDQHSDAGDTSSMHFGAVRQIVRSIGGPLNIRSTWLSRLMAHFECTAGTKFSSYVWDRSDFGQLHTELNQLFCNVWSVQREPPMTYDGKRKSMQISARHQCTIGLKPHSTLLECISRRAENLSNPTQQERLELTFQITCLFLLSTVIVDQQADPQAVNAYIDSVHELVEASQLRHLPSNNIVWLLQVHDQSEAHTKRIWAAAGWVWVLRHVSFNVQCMVRDWLISILTGKPVIRALKLDSFAFSYAS